MRTGLLSAAAAAIIVLATMAFTLRRAIDALSGFVASPQLR
jgi:hypothetical protein